MIDAQCTLDASVRHILHYGKLGWKDFKPSITEETVDLQVLIPLRSACIVRASRRKDS
jgi:hypothetical protein